jgi:hypothetical protein
VTFLEPSAQDLGGRLVDGRITSFPALAKAFDVSGGAQVDILEAQTGELGQT